MDYYFIEEDGGRFKATLPFPPYFYVLTKKDTERDVSSFLSRKLSGRITGIDLVDKEDMDLVSEVLLPLVELHLSLHSLLLSLTSLSHLSLSIHFFSLSPLSLTCLSPFTSSLSHLSPPLPNAAKPSGWTEEEISETQVPLGRGPDEGQAGHYASCEEEQGEREISIGVRPLPLLHSV